MLGLLYMKSLSPKVRRTTVMEFTKVVAERYSCKNFSTRKVEAEKLTEILEAGRLAPTSKNSQLYPPRHPPLRHGRAELCTLPHHSPCSGRGRKGVPASHRPQLYPAQVGVRSGPEPLRLQDRGRHPGGGRAVQGQRSAAGHDLHGY